MKKFFIWFLPLAMVAFFVAGCGEKKDNSEEKDTTENTSETTGDNTEKANKPSSAQKNENSDVSIDELQEGFIDFKDLPQDFREFYGRFEAAAMQGQYDKIIAVTSFPFSLHGMLIDKREFGETISRNILMDDVMTSFDFETNKYFIQRQDGDYYYQKGFVIADKVNIYPYEEMDKRLENINNIIRYEVAFDSIAGEFEQFPGVTYLDFAKIGGEYKFVQVLSLP